MLFHRATCFSVNFVYLATFHFGFEQSGTLGQVDGKVPMQDPGINLFYVGLHITKYVLFNILFMPIWFVQYLYNVDVLVHYDIILM